MKLFLKRPIAVFMITVAVVLLGLIATFKIPTSLLPEIQVPNITVFSSDPKLSAREIENSVTSILRQQLAQVQNIQQIESESHDAYSIIKLNYNFGTNSKLAYIEANEKIDAALNFLPKDLQRPRVIRANASDIPVMYVNLSLKENYNENSFMQLSELAEFVIKRRFEQLSTVAMADISGLIRPEVVIELNRDKINRLNLDISFFEKLLRSNNIEQGNLIISNGNYRYNLKFENSLKNIEDIKNIAFTAYEKQFLLSDFADVYLKKIRENGLIKLNNKRVISLAVIKQSNARNSDLKTELQQTIANLKDNYPQVDIQITEDQSKLLDLSISNLKDSLLIGASLAVLIIFFFLKNPKSPLLIAVSIPTSLLLSLLLLYLFGFSINIISLSGLVLGVGMMIDNSIIVIDNISRERENGLSLAEAAYKGTIEVFTPMLSSMLTTISVFLPLMFLSGIAGALFYDQAIAVSIGLGSSLIVSVTLIPVYFIVLNKKTYSWEKKLSGIDFVSNLEGIYEKGMTFFIENKSLSIIISIGFIVVFFLLFSILKIEKLPEINSREYSLFIDWNEDISPESNSKRISDLSLGLDKNSTVKAQIGQQEYLLNQHKPLEYYQAQIYLNLNNSTKEINYIKDYLEMHYPKAIYRIKRADNAFEQVFNDNKKYLRAKVASTKGKQIPPVEEFDQIEKLLSAHKFKTESVSGRNLFLDIDNDKLTEYKIDYNFIIDELETVLDNKNIGNLLDPQRMYPLKLKYEYSDLENFIKQAHIRNSDGNMYPVRNFVKIVEKDQYRVIYADNSGEFLSFSKDKSQNIKEETENLREEISDRYVINFDGSYKDINDMKLSFILIVFISFSLLYFILAAQFESFTIPFIVLLEVPIDIGASLLLLFIFGQTLNVMSAIGIIVMSGIIINDSILKIHTINTHRKNGLNIYDAVKLGGKQRLKPILMTSITTILALLPFLFLSGLGADLQKPLALAVIGGLAVGTWVSLYFIPLVYIALEKTKIKLKGLIK